MEPVFENRCIFTKQMIKESVIAPIRWIVPFRIVMTVLACVLSLGYLVMAVSGMEIEKSTYVVGFFLMLSMLFAWIFPSISANAILRKGQKANPDGRPESIVWFGDWIETNDAGNARIKFEYSQIHKVYSLKSRYVLVIKNQMLILDRNGFCKGTFEEFKQFLREKRSDLTVVE